MKLEVKNCEYCGRPFKVTKRSKRFCNSNCTNKSYHERVGSKEKYQEKRAPLIKVFERDKFKCRYCGAAVEDGVKLTIDHVYPLDKGGQNDFYNLVTACSRCNSRKSTSLFKEETLLRIWTENRDLDIGSGTDKSYEELRTEFNEIYKRRTSQKDN